MVHATSLIDLRSVTINFNLIQSPIEEVDGDVAVEPRTGSSTCDLRSEPGALSSSIDLRSTSGGYCDYYLTEGQPPEEKKKVFDRRSKSSRFSG